MFVSSRRSAFRRFVERKGRQWCFEVVISAIIAIAVVFGLMVFFHTPVAEENKSRLEEQFRENRQQAIQEYEADEREREKSAGVIETASTPAGTPVR